MADWYGSGRTNYVKIKDMAGLKAAVADFDVRVSEGVGDNAGRVCFLAEGQFGGFEDRWDQGTDTAIDFDPAVLICPYMQKGEVLVMIEAGAEKLRYISGYAQAWHSDGRYVSLSLTEIYKKAAKKFGVSMSKITAAEY